MLAPGSDPADAVLADLGNGVILERLNGHQVFRLTQSQQLIWADRITWQQAEALCHYLYEAQQGSGAHHG